MCNPFAGGIISNMLSQVKIYHRSIKKSRNEEQAKKKTVQIKSKPFIWRRRRDLNPRAGFPTYALSRGASSPLEYFCIMVTKLNI